MRKWLLPTLAILCFIFESVFIQVLPSELFELERIMIPRFVMVIIVIITMFTSLTTGMTYGFVMGLLYDLMYTDLIGVYMFAYTFIAYGVAMIMKLLHINIFTVILMTLLSIGILDFFVYGIMLVIKTTSIPTMDFLTVRLLPTLVLNLAFVILLFVPLRKQFLKIIDTNKDE
ncbi:rod shape-determining protein MreD [Bacillus mesophilus]|uniref:Rod shape-determining protein MreD n=1 Tax=Bacillus mesophilus TaxID=1808955 RepID=A0A6M0Q674_9BACI|nr:rod shape-determining protein MreD [Bacillus mesophilus]MBM7660658.1 rod shape-determining protein MreD [Bacillus mesophilus]NEY71794.1 rod shape-determining protein MreD [Bacillus mesophilus]